MENERRYIYRVVASSADPIQGQWRNVEGLYETAELALEAIARFLKESFPKHTHTPLRGPYFEAEVISNRWNPPDYRVEKVPVYGRAE